MTGLLAACAIAAAGDPGRSCLGASSPSAIEGNGPTTQPAEEDSALPGALTDVTLRGVWFVDRLRGWVVGDAGTILKTEDAGQTWALVPSGTTASLERVHFVDRTHGWAVGGLSRLLRPGGVGVVLRTEDGGATWVRVLLPEAGWLHHVRFADRLTGWACGEASPGVPSGLLYTTNGGVTWAPVKVPAHPPLPFGERVGVRGRVSGAGEAPTLTLPSPWKGEGAPETAAPAPVGEPLQGGSWSPRLFGLTLTIPPRGWVAGAGGLIGPFRLDQGLDEPAPFTAGAALRAVQFVDARRGWAAGDRGHIYATTDGGTTWVRADLPWQAETRDAYTVNDLFFVDWHLGVAVGHPGTTILETRDGGRTWCPRQTHQRSSLHGVHFVNERRGYAVGELGTILRTSDGGHHWEVMHRADVRLSLLVLNVAPGGYPWTLLARYAYDQGYRTAVLDWTEAADEPALWTRAAALRRACQAVAVPVSAVTAAQGIDDLCRDLVRAIRTYRPEVVLVALDPNRPVRNEAALAAARKAFQTAHEPEGTGLVAGESAAEASSQLLREWGLEGWRPRRLLTVAPEADGGGLDRRQEAADVRTDVLEGKVCAARLGTTYSEVGLRAAEQLRQRPATVLHNDRLHLVAEVGPRPPGAAERLFLGAHVPAGTAGRRALTLVSPAQAARAELISEATQNLWFAYLLACRQDRMAPVINVAGDFTARFPESAEGALALAAAAEYLETRGDPGSAYLAYAGMGRAGPGCPGLASAMYKQAAYLARGVADPELVHYLDPSAYDLERLLAQRQRENERILAHALAAAERFEVLFPGERGLPELAFTLAAAYRVVGRQREALQLCAPYADWPTDSPWRANARGELWMAGQPGLPAKRVLVAQPAERPPVLDGRLDDPCWRASAAEPILPPGARGRPSGAHDARLRVVYDEEALYVAFEGLSLQPPTPAEAEERRRQGYGFQDRVELLLDVNRDYCTHTRFALTLPTTAAQEGPAWRARASLGEDRFVVEGAIELRDLNVYRIRPGTVWGVNAAVIRRDGRMSLSGDAPLAATEHFAYLQFGRK